MNKLICALALGMLGASFSAAACPNLSGKYVCASDGQAYGMTLTQAEQNGATVYSFLQDGETQSSDVVASGQRQDIPENNGFYTATCDQDSVKIVFEGDATDDQGNFMGRVSGTQELRLTPTGDLSQSLDGQLVDKGGQKMPISQTDTCKKQ